MNREQLALYAVTDRSWLNGRSLQEVVEEAIRGGVTMVQLREKNLDKALFLKEALELKKICHTHDVPLLINDDVEICRLADADGVHIGQEDMRIAEARSLLGKDKIIGVTVHNTEQALIAAQEHADYLGAGAAFGSTTKQNVQRLSRDGYLAITGRVSVPVVAIVGGMAVFAPLALPASFVRFELPAVMALTLLVYPLLRSDRRVSRQEGAILCLAFAAWVALELLLFL